MRAPTGEQYELTRSTAAGQARAVITEVAAGIREYSIDGIDLSEPFPENRTPPQGVGIVLVPWPNRIKDGAWELNGTKQQLALTEPDRHNAIHGLLRFAPYRVVDRGDSAVTLAATVFPQLGYPFHLETTVRHELVDDGMVVTHSLTNVGDATAPVAVGAHPYFKIGDVPTAELTLTLAATQHFEVDDRMNVTGESPVDDTKYDLRGGVRVGDLDLDDGWGGVVLTDGQSTQTLTAADGRSVSLWADENFDYVQVYTTRTLPTDTVSDVAIAIEPMTAPVNAFNSGTGVHALEPGDEWVVRWGIRHAGFGG